MSEPKREDYPTDEAFLDAACKHYGIPTWMTKELPKEVYEHAARAWEEIRKSKGNVITAEPRRYEPDYEGQMTSNHKGNYVLMQDYSFLRKEAEALKREVERLKSVLQHTDRLLLVDGEFEAYSVGTIERANARLERLIEAGDAMADGMVSEYGQRECKKIPEYINWQAAKEVQS